MLGFTGLSTTRGSLRPPISLTPKLEPGPSRSPRSFVRPGELEANAARVREKGSEHLFPLMIGQSVGLDARFGGQITGLTVGRVKSRTRGGVEEVAPAGWKSREEETN